MTNPKAGKHRKLSGAAAVAHDRRLAHQAWESGDEGYGVRDCLREGEIKGLLRAARLAKALMGRFATHEADASVGDLVVKLRAEAAKLRKGGR